MDATVLDTHIGVRDGGGGQGGSCPPPIWAVCRHEFGQRVDIILAKHNPCLNNTNLGSVTAVNGKILPPHRIWIPANFCYYPPHIIWIAENFCYYPPPTLNPFGQNSVCPPPKWTLARRAYAYVDPYGQEWSTGMELQMSTTMEYYFLASVQKSTSLLITNATFRMKDL